VGILVVVSLGAVAVGGWYVIDQVIYSQQAPTWRESLAYDAFRGDVVLPSLLPDGAEAEGSYLVSNELRTRAGISMYADDRSRVDLCPGSQRKCSRLSPQYRVVLSTVVAQVPVTVLARPPVRPETTAFWRTVDLTTSEPAWLDSTTRDS
ncbi:MAG: hypothetical protein ABI586_08905, partial [Candidatus Nanopelagicales bacterium]